MATLILGVLVALWHLLLWILPQFGASPGDILGTLGVTLWYTWLFNHTGGSVLMTIVAHASEGTIQTEAFWSAGAAAARMSLLYGVVWCRGDRLGRLRLAVVTCSCACNSDDSAGL